MSLFRESVPDRDSYRTAHTAYSQDPDLAVPLWTLSGHSQGPKYHRLLWRGDILGACKQPYEHIVCLLEKKQQAILSLKPLLKETHSPPPLMLMLSQKGCQPQLSLLLTRGSPADSFTPSAAGQCQPVGLQACGQSAQLMPASLDCKYCVIEKQCHGEFWTPWRGQADDSLFKQHPTRDSRDRKEMKWPKRNCFKWYFMFN